MRWILGSLLAVAALVAMTTGGPRDAWAKACSDPVALAAARAAVAAQCNCDTATSHGQYVKCVAQVASQLAKAGTLPKECRGTVTHCAADSTCGKAGFVTCCRIDKKGKNHCSIKRSADKCNAPRGGSACVGAAKSCCDACVAGSAGGAFTCQNSTTTTTAASTTTTTRPGSPSGAFADD